MPTPTIIPEWDGYTDWQLYLAYYATLSHVSNHEQRKGASVSFVQNFYPNFTMQDAEIAHAGANDYYADCMVKAAGVPLKEGKCLGSVRTFWPDFDPNTPQSSSGGSTGGSGNNTTTDKNNKLTDSNLSTKKNTWIIWVVAALVLLLVVAWFMGWFG